MTDPSLKRSKRAFRLVFLVVALLATLIFNSFPFFKAEAAEQRVPTNEVLYNKVSWHRADQWKGPWVAPSGATIVKAYFQGKSEVRYDYGYLYAYVDGQWIRVAGRSGTYGYWVNLPAGTTQIKTRITTDRSVLWNPTYTTVAEVVINIPHPQSPGKPQLLTERFPPTPYNVKMTWSANGNPSGTTYELWRKTFDASGRVVKDEKIYSGTGTSFITTDQEPGRYYRYRVRAIYQGKTSDFSPETTYWTAPRTKSLQPVERGFKVSWHPVFPGVTYRVHMKPEGEGWREVGKTTETSFVATNLDPMKKHRVTMVPTYEEGGPHWCRSSGEVYPLAATPGRFSFSASTNSIKVRWSANGNPSGVRYELYRDGVKIYEGTSTSYRDTRLKPNRTYKYKVRAKNGAGQYTAFREATWGTAPVAPSISTLSYAGQRWSNTGDGKVQVILNWDAVDGAKGYKVYVNGRLAPNGDVGNKTVWRGDLPSGASLQLQVTAYNAYGESSKSSARSILPPNRKDTEAPRVQMLINNGQLIAASKHVTVNVSAVDPHQANYTKETSADDASNPKRVRISNDNKNWSAWIPYGFTDRALAGVSTSFEHCDFYFEGNAQNRNGVILGIGDYWRVSTHYNTARIKSMSDGGLHGRKYVRFEHDGSKGWKGLVRGVKIIGGKWYRITAYVRTNSETPVNPRSWAFHYHGRAPLPLRKHLEWEKEIVAGNGWVKGQVVFQAPETMWGGIYLYGLYDGPSGVTLDYDYVAVEEFDQRPTGDITPNDSLPWALDEKGFGKKTVYVQVQDSAGNIGTAQADINYYLVDMQAPSVKLAINGGQQYTSSPDVALEVEAKDDLTQADRLKMRFSNDFRNWTEWMPYQPYTQWTLTRGDGMKTVHVQVQDASGNIGTAHASIVLRAEGESVQVNPAVVSSPSGRPGTLNLDGRAVNVRFVKGAEVILALNAPGASWVQYSMDNVRWTAPEPVVAQKTLVLPDWEGTKTVYVRFPDGSVYNIAFVLDRTPPDISVSWRGGATASSGSTAVAEIAAVDNFTPDEQLEVSADGANWTPYTGSLTVNLPRPGYNKVTIWVRDMAGNVAKETLGMWRLN